jgi:hypothetical protein
LPKIDFSEEPLFEYNQIWKLWSQTSATKPISGHDDGGDDLETIPLSKARSSLGSTAHSETVSQSRARCTKQMKPLVIGQAAVRVISRGQKATPGSQKASKASD